MKRLAAGVFAVISVLVILVTFSLGFFSMAFAGDAPNADATPLLIFPAIGIVAIYSVVVNVRIAFWGTDRLWMQGLVLGLIMAAIFIYACINLSALDFLKIFLGLEDRSMDAPRY